MDVNRGIQQSTDAVLVLVGALQDLAENTEEARAFYSDPINPNSYPEHFQKQVAEIKKGRRAEESRNRSELAELITRLDELTRRARGEVDQVSVRLAGHLKVSERTICGVSDSSLHSAVVTFSEGLLSQFLQVALPLSISAY